MNEFRERFVDLIEEFRRSAVELGDGPLWVTWDWRAGIPDLLPRVTADYEFLCFLRLPLHAAEDVLTPYPEGEILLPLAASAEQRHTFCELAREAGSFLPGSFATLLDRCADGFAQEQFGSDFHVARWCALLFFATGNAAVPPIEAGERAKTRVVERAFSTSLKAIQTCGLTTPSPSIPGFVAPPPIAPSVVGGVMDNPWRATLESARRLLEAERSDPEYKVAGLFVIERELRLIDGCATEPCTIAELADEMGWSDDGSNGMKPSIDHVQRTLKAIFQDKVAIAFSARRPYARLVPSPPSPEQGNNTAPPC